MSLQRPNDIFRMDNILSDKLNDFQTRYSRYVRCQHPTSATGVTSPPCDLNGDDSFANVQAAYRSLLKSINDTDRAFQVQALDGDAVADEVSDEELMAQYKQVTELRAKLDQQLAELYSDAGTGGGIGGSASSQEELKTAVYANTMWIILASCLVWFVIVKLE
jgi:hypothetical protein